MILTTRMGNEVLEALKAGGLDPATCKLEDPMPESRFMFSNPLTGEQPPGRARAIHRPTGSTFTISRAQEKAFEYTARMKVGQADFGGLTSRSWSQLLRDMQDWAGYVRDEEGDVPDLWAELQEVPEVLTATQAADASNEPFTADEQATIAGKIGEARQLVRENPELTSEQLAAIEERLDHIEESSTRLGRKDWLMLAIGTIMTLDGPRHVVQMVVTLVLHGLGHMFGIGGPPPMITT